MSGFDNNYSSRILELAKIEPSKNWQDIELLANSIIHEYPNSIYVHKRLGRALEKQGKISEAIICYEQAIEVALTARAGYTHFINRLDILFRREKKYHDCLQLCVFYADTHYFSENAFSKLSRAAKLSGLPELSTIAGKLSEILSAPFKPKGEFIPESDEALMRAAEISDDDIRRAIDEWNELLPEYSGMLEAEVITGEELNNEIYEINDVNKPIRQRIQRPSYSESEIKEITKKISKRVTKCSA